MFKKFIDWIKSSFEGVDGKSSARMLTAFWIVILATTLHFAVYKIGVKIIEKETPTESALRVIDAYERFLIIDYVVLMLLYSIVSAQNILQGIKAVRGEKTESADPETKKEVTEIEMK